MPKKPLYTVRSNVIEPTSPVISHSSRRHSSRKFLPDDFCLTSWPASSLWKSSPPRTTYPRTSSDNARLWRMKEEPQRAGTPKPEDAEGIYFPRRRALPRTETDLEVGIYKTGRYTVGLCKKGLVLKQVGTLNPENSLGIYPLPSYDNRLVLPRTEKDFKTEFTGHTNTSWGCGGRC